MTPGFIYPLGEIVDDTVINGNGTIDGVVYTLGEFRINSGGGNLNVNVEYGQERK